MRQQESKAFKDSISQLRVIPITGDGNCLFRSLSYGYYGSEEEHKSIRKEIVHYVTNNWEDFVEQLSATCVENRYISAEDYEKRMSKDGEYGTDFELAMFVNLYETKVILYMLTEDKKFVKTGTFIPLGSEEMETQNFFKLLFSGNKRSGHFEVLEDIKGKNAKIKVEKDEKKDITDRFLLKFRNEAKEKKKDYAIHDFREGNFVNKDSERTCLSDEGREIEIEVRRVQKIDWKNTFFDTRDRINGTEVEKIREKLYGHANRQTNKSSYIPEGTGNYLERDLAVFDFLPEAEKNENISGKENKEISEQEENNVRTKKEKIEVTKRNIFTTVIQKEEIIIEKKWIVTRLLIQIN